MKSYRIQICTSHRPKLAGGGCCHDKGAEKILQALQRALQQEGLEEQVKVVESACLKNCPLGVSMRVLPDMTMYGQLKMPDLEEIVSQHLLKGQVVERLQISPGSILDQF